VRLPVLTRLYYNQDKKNEEEHKNKKLVVPHFVRSKYQAINYSIYKSQRARLWGTKIVGALVRPCRTLLVWIFRAHLHAHGVFNNSRFNAAHEFIVDNFQIAQKLQLMNYPIEVHVERKQQQCRGL